MKRLRKTSTDSRAPESVQHQKRYRKNVPMDKLELDEEDEIEETEEGQYNMSDE